MGAPGIGAVAAPSQWDRPAFGCEDNSGWRQWLLATGDDHRPVCRRICVREVWHIGFNRPPSQRQPALPRGRRDYHRSAMLLTHGRAGFGDLGTMSSHRSFGKAGVRLAALAAAVLLSGCLSGGGLAARPWIGSHAHMKRLMRARDRVDGVVHGRVHRCTYPRRRQRTHGVRTDRVEQDVVPVDDLVGRQSSRG